jgi:hypothetical protein
MNNDIPTPVKEALFASRATKFAKLIKENQFATAVGFFVLWQFGLLGDAIAYIGC